MSVSLLRAQLRAIPRSLEGASVEGSRRLLALAALLSLAVASACPADDVDLGRLEVRSWQPRVLASGEGDLLDDAERVDVTLYLDGEEEETFPLGAGLSAPDRAAAPDGSTVRVRLSTVGDTLPDALARSGPARLDPGGGDVVVTALLAPPDVEHMLEASLPDARSAMATCASTSGRVWAVGGLLGGAVASGSFLVDPLARAVGEGPAFAEQRAHAACVADESGGVYLAGGCTEAGVAVGGLVHSEGGDLGSPFVDVDPLPGAGCHTRLARLDDGRLVALTGDELVLYSPQDEEAVARGIPTRRAALLQALPGDDVRVLVSGGFRDEQLSLPVTGGVIYLIEGDVIVDNIPLSRSFAAATTDADGAVIVVEGQHIGRLAPDGSLDHLYEGVVPGGFSPTQIAPLHDGRFALLSGDGASVLIVGGDGNKTVPLAVARPGARLLADAGGALLILGGGAAGISAIVVE